MEAEIFGPYDEESIWLPGQALFCRGRLKKANGLGQTPNQPPGPNQKVDRILKKGRLISFNRMPNELKDPAADEQRQRPAPVEKEEEPRNCNHRNADEVTQFVQRMLMLGFVIFDERFSHDRWVPSFSDRFYDPLCLLVPTRR